MGLTHWKVTRVEILGILLQNVPNTGFTEKIAVDLMKVYYPDS